MRKPFVFILLFTAVLLASCNLPRSGQATETAGGPGLVQTYAAQTLEALGTQLAENTPTPPALPTEALPTLAPNPPTATATVPGRPPPSP